MNQLKPFPDLCPDPELLAEFLLGKLPLDELESCEIHLAHCPPCTETIRSLNVNDTFSDLAKDVFENELSNDAGYASVTEQTAVSDLVGRMKELGEGAFVLAEHGDGPFEFPKSFAAPRIDDDGVAAARVTEVQRHFEKSENEDTLGRLAHYQVERVLGVGSSGVVFLATDENLHRPVALKILRPSLGNSARDRFVAEARAMASIDDSNVVSIFHVGTEGDLAYIAMQWTPGETLDQRLKREGAFEPEQVRLIGKQIASGLAAAHRIGLIHRDIKPANIWLESETGKVKILDFGLVRATDADPGLTCTGMIAGTPCFMSPEQARGSELDFRSDIFSLGCVLYEMLTGELPFRSANVLATLQSIRTDSPEPPHAIGASIPEDLSTLVMCMLQKSPADRPSNSASVVEALGLPISEWDFEPTFAAATVKPSLRSSLNSASSSKRPIRNNAVDGPMRLSKAGWFRWVGTLAACALLFSGVFYSQQIIRIATNQGELVIETNDPDIKIEVIDDGGKIRIIDLKTDESFDIVAGKYELRPQSDENSIEIDRQTITMKRGSKEIVKVTRVDASGASDTPMQGDFQKMFATPRSAEDQADSPLFSQLIASRLIASKLMERARVTEVFGSKHPRMIALNDELTELGYDPNSRVPIESRPPWFSDLLMSKKVERRLLMNRLGPKHPKVIEIGAELGALGCFPEKVRSAEEAGPADDFRKWEKQLRLLQSEVKTLSALDDRMQSVIADFRKKVWQNDPFLCGLDQYSGVASTKRRWFMLVIDDLPVSELSDEVEWLDDFNSRMTGRLEAAKARLKEMTKLVEEFSHLEKHSDREGAAELQLGCGLKLKEYGYRFNKPNKRHSTISLTDFIGPTTEEDEWRRALASFQIAFSETKTKLEAARSRQDERQIESLEREADVYELRVKQIELQFESNKVFEKERELNLQNKEQREALRDPIITSTQVPGQSTSVGTEFTDGANSVNANLIISKWLEKRKCQKVFGKGHKTIVRLDRELKALGHDASKQWLPEVLAQNKRLLSELIARKWAERQQLSSKFGAGHNKVVDIDRLIGKIALAAWKGGDEVDSIAPSNVPYVSMLSNVQSKMKERTALAEHFDLSHPIVKKIDRDIRRLGFDPEQSTLQSFEALKKPPSKEFKALKTEVAKLDAADQLLQKLISTLKEHVWSTDLFLNGLMTYSGVASTKKRWYEIAIDNHLSKGDINEELAWINDFNSRLESRIQAAKIRHTELTQRILDFHSYQGLDDPDGKYVEQAKVARKKLQDVGYRFGASNPISSSFNRSDIIEPATDQDESRRASASIQLAFVDAESKLEAARAAKLVDEIPKLELQFKKYELKVREIEIEKERKKVFQESNRPNLDSEKYETEKFVDPQDSIESQLQKQASSEKLTEPIAPKK